MSVPARSRWSWTLGGLICFSIWVALFQGACTEVPPIDWGPTPIPGNWRFGPAAGIARGGALTAVVDGRLYVLSGDESHSAFERFDPGTNAWEILAPIPTTVPSTEYGVATSVADKIYVAQCCQGVGGATLAIYDSVAATWSLLAAPPTSAQHFAFGAVAGKLYLAGGRTPQGDRLDSFYEYDPVANAWTPLPSMPTARAHAHAAVLDSNHFFVIGGLANAGSGSGSFDDVESYNPQTGIWSKHASTISAGARGAAVLEGKVFAIGGEDPDGHPIARVEVYELEEDKWIPAPSIAGAEFMFQPATVGTSIYIVGNGLSLRDFEQGNVSPLRTTDVEVFTLASPTQTGTPTPAPTPYTGPPRVFLSAGTHDGNFGGLALADQYCETEAAGGTRTQGGSGSWTAWLSDASTNAIDRILGTGPWVQTDVAGTTVFVDRTNLTNNAPVVVIDKDQNGVTDTASRTDDAVWTGTLANGTAASGNHCSSWSQPSGTGRQGLFSIPTNKWTDIQDGPCGSSYHLYCFEDP